MSQSKIPTREYGRTFRSSEFNKSEINHLFIGGWEFFDLDVFTGRKSTVEVQPRKPKQSKNEKVS